MLLLGRPQEPLLQAMELLQHTDVLLGMHGAGWTNGMFIKHGAVAMQARLGAILRLCMLLWLCPAALIGCPANGMPSSMALWRCRRAVPLCAGIRHCWGTSFCEAIAQPMAPHQPMASTTVPARLP